MCAFGVTYGAQLVAQKRTAKVMVYLHDRRNTFLPLRESLTILHLTESVAVDASVPSIVAVFAPSLLDLAITSSWAAMTGILDLEALWAVLAQCTKLRKLKYGFEICKWAVLYT
jgi:hypothetical protein